MARFLEILLFCLALSGALARTCTERGKGGVKADNKEGDYDFIVVGAGAGGAVVASRLASQFKVLLLESGPKLYDDATSNAALVDSCLPGNGFPMEVGKVKVGGTVVGTLGKNGVVTDDRGNEIGLIRREVPMESPAVARINGEDVTGKYEIESPAANPLAVPDGSSFGLHMQKTPMMVTFESLANTSTYYTTTPQLWAQKREVYYPRGRMVGGSSGTNWMVFYKGTRRDFDEDWKGKHGLEGWGYDDLEPYFRKFETAEDVPHPKKHGNSGPIRTSTSKNFITYPALEAWHEAAKKLGWPEIQDANDPENQWGASNAWLQLVSKDGRRSDSSDYVRLEDERGNVCWNKPYAQCGQDQNLHILTEVLVTKVLIEEGTLRTRGVEYVSAKELPNDAFHTDHPLFEHLADEGLKHRYTFTKWDKTLQERPGMHRQGAPVHRDLAMDYKNPGGQFIPGKRSLAGLTRTALTKKEVILSAGAIGTAQLLMLSGVGPEDHLRGVQVKPLVDLPVGRRLQDHQETTVHYRFPPTYTPHFDFAKESAKGFPSVAAWAAGKRSFLGSNHVVGGLEGSSAGPKSKEKHATYHMHHAAFGPLENADFHMGLAKESSDEPYRAPRAASEFFEWKGSRIHSHLCELSGNHAYGQVDLRNNDPLSEPLIDFRYGSSMEDNLEIVACIKEVRKIMETADPQYTGTEVGACAEAHSDDELVQCVRNAMWGHHMASTAPMGKCDSKFGVTDTRARVFHVEGLRVADISIFPEIPHGNPTGVVFASAEKIADMIKEDYEGKAEGKAKGEL